MNFLLLLRNLLLSDNVLTEFLSDNVRKIKRIFNVITLTCHVINFRYDEVRMLRFFTFVRPLAAPVVVCRVNRGGNRGKWRSFNTDDRFDDNELFNDKNRSESDSMKIVSWYS